jgi:hypothetical protein
MDAAFFPHLRKLDFKQEGWRLEHENPTGKLTMYYLYSQTMRTGRTDSLCRQQVTNCVQRSGL